jgi:lipoic acid synthetase
MVAAAAASLGLKHVVVTSVTRDDLADGGASFFAAVIRAVRQTSPDADIEALVPDFRGSDDALKLVAQERPDVLGHNLETVARLYPVLRPAASYGGSLRLLSATRRYSPDTFTKSGIMVGVGETEDDFVALVRDLVASGCHSMTVGQYLQPTSANYPVQRYLAPEEFLKLKEIALDLGITAAAAGPMIRSSYRAGEILAQLRSSYPADHVSPQRAQPTARDAPPVSLI